MTTEDHLWKRKNNLFQFSHSCKALVSGFLAPVWFQGNIQFICIFPNVGFTVLPRCQQTPTHWRMKTKPSSSSTFVPYQFLKSKRNTQSTFIAQGTPNSRFKAILGISIQSHFRNPVLVILLGSEMNSLSNLKHDSTMKSELQAFLV